MYSREEYDNWKINVDKHKIYTGVNADELEIGDQVYVGNSLEDLIHAFFTEDVKTLVDIECQAVERRFIISANRSYALAYVVKHVDLDKFRPYTDCNEMMDEVRHMNGLHFDDPVLPMTWVKHKEEGDIFLITEYDERTSCVLIGGRNYVTLEALFKDYVYLNGDPCGIHASAY